MGEKKENGRKSPFEIFLSDGSAFNSLLSSVPRCVLSQRVPPAGATLWVPQGLPFTPSDAYTLLAAFQHYSFTPYTSALRGFYLTGRQVLVKVTVRIKLKLLA